MTTPKKLARQILQRQAQGKSATGLFFEATKKGGSFEQQVQKEVRRLSEGKESERFKELTPEEFSLSQASQKGIARFAAAKETELKNVKQLRERLAVEKQLKLKDIGTASRIIAGRQERLIIKDIPAQKVSRKIEKFKDGRSRLVRPEEITITEIPAEKLILKKEKDKTIFDKLTDRVKLKFSKEEFSKFNEGVKQVELINQEIRRINRDKGAGELVTEGKLPGAVITAYDFGGEKILTGLDIIGKKVFGGERLSEEDIKIGGQVVGEIALFAGFAPVLSTTGEVIAKLPQNTVVRFVGKQTQKGRNIITDVVFQSSGKTVGSARGVTLVKGKQGFTFTIGKQTKIKAPKKLKPFVGVEKALSTKDILKISKLFEVPRKTLTQLLKRNAQMRKLFLLRKNAQNQLRRINEILRKSKVNQKIIKLKSGAKFRRTSLIIRKDKLTKQLSNTISKINSGLKDFKGFERIGKIKEGSKFRRTSLIIRKNKLSNQLKRINDLLRKSKVGQKIIKLKSGAKFRRTSLIIRKNKILSQLKKIDDLLVPTKTIKKIKVGIKFKKANILIRKQKLKNQLSTMLNELKRLKSLKRVSSELRFRRNSLIIRKNKILAELRKIPHRILPKKLEIIVTRNLKKVTQVSGGKIKVGKGSSDIEEIFSMAHVFSKDDLSKIVGETFTKKGDRINFVGFIKNIGKDQPSFRLTQIQTKQYSKALEDVMKVVGATAKVKPKIRLSTGAKSLIGSNKLKIVLIKPKQVPSISKKQAVISKETQAVALKPTTNIKQGKAQISKLNQRVKQLGRIKQRPQLKARTKQNEKIKQRITNRIKSLQKQKQRVALKIRQLQKTKQKQKPKPIIKIRPKIPPMKIKVIPLFIPKGFTKKKLKTKQPVYLVVMRRRGKLIKLAARPLLLKDARDYLAYRLDRGLGRSAWFEPIGFSKEVLGLPKAMRGYFNKVRKKLRPYKIDRGRKLGIRRGFIERKKFVGDTRQEIRQLQQARTKAKRRVKKRIVRRPKKRKIVKRFKKKRIVKRRVKKKVIKRKSQKKKLKTRKVKRKVRRKLPLKRKKTKKKRVIKRRKKK